MRQPLRLSKSWIVSKARLNILKMLSMELKNVLKNSIAKKKNDKSGLAADPAKEDAE